MEPNNPANPQDSQTPPQNPGTGIPQPLNTSAQVPTEMPIGEPTPPPPSPQNEGLPSNLPNSPQVNKAPGKSGKFILMSIIVLIVIILGIGGYYFYANMNLSGNKQTPESPKATQNNQNKEEVAGLATELEELELTDPEGDLEEINQEINSLEATQSSR